jgi:hypothetical protein
LVKEVLEIEVHFLLHVGMASSGIKLAKKPMLHKSKRMAKKTF